MMIPFETLRRIAKNPHTSAAAIVYGIAKFGSNIACVWYPGYKDRIEQTANYIEGLAGFWGLLFAGDAATSEKQVAAVDQKADQVASVVRGDTTILPKATVPAAPVLVADAVVSSVQFKDGLSVMPGPVTGTALDKNLTGRKP